MNRFKNYTVKEFWDKFKMSRSERTTEVVGNLEDFVDLLNRAFKELRILNNGKHRFMVKSVPIKIEDTGSEYSLPDDFHDFSDPLKIGSQELKHTALEGGDSRDLAPNTYTRIGRTLILNDIINTCSTDKCDITEKYIHIYYYKFLSSIRCASDIISFPSNLEEEVFDYIVESVLANANKDPSPIALIKSKEILLELDRSSGPIAKSSKSLDVYRVTFRG